LRTVGVPKAQKKNERETKASNKEEKQVHIWRFSSIADVFGIGKVVSWPESR